MNDIIVDINNYETEFKNIILGKKIITNNFIKYSIYLDKDLPYNLLIKIPSIRLMYNYHTLTYNSINIPLNPETKKIERDENGLARIIPMSGGEKQVQQKYSSPEKLLAIYMTTFFKRYTFPLFKSTWESFQNLTEFPM